MLLIKLMQSSPQARTHMAAQTACKREKKMDVSNWIKDSVDSATEKLFESENSDAAPTLLWNVLKIVSSLLPNTI